MKRLEEIAEHDWKKSKKLDLSDEGLLKDLQKREGLDPEKLALVAGETKPKDKKPK